MMDIELIDRMGRDAKAASLELGICGADIVNAALRMLAERLRQGAELILAANEEDLIAGRKKGLSPALLDRLALDDARIEGMACGVDSIASMEDPVGSVLEQTERPNGLIIDKVSVPIGVLGMIYESRPNVTIDAAALCLRSHNAVILRGGSESFHSSFALYEIVRSVLEKSGLPVASVQMVPDTDRAYVGHMLSAHQWIDAIIPRGGKGLTSRVMAEAKMPVFAHLDGICHSYVHASSVKSMAVDVCVNAKMRRTGICGATETILFDDGLSDDLAGAVIDRLIDAGCDVVGDGRACDIDGRVGLADENDWSCEYLDSKVSIKYVEDVEAACTHINHYGSHHTDAILAECQTAVETFFARVDSANVMHNCSTQFADGGEFGMGAEIGIATGKMHARGPVGARQLTTYKYLVRGAGQVRPA